MNALHEILRKAGRGKLWKDPGPERCLAEIVDELGITREDVEEATESRDSLRRAVLLNQFAAKFGALLDGAGVP